MIKYVRSKTVYSGLVKQAGGPAWTGALVGARAFASARLDVRHLLLIQTGLRYLSFSLASVEITSYDVVLSAASVEITTLYILALRSLAFV